METLGAFKRMDSLNRFESDLRRARIESITQGGRGIVEMNASGHGYQMGIDYWPFNAGSDIEATLFAANFGSEINLNASDTIIFNSRGFLVNQSGVPTTVTFTFSFRGGEFCAGSVFSSGVLELNCR